MRSDIRSLTIQHDQKISTISGRMAWCLAELVAAGAKGITSLENPAPRLSHYIFRLRREGLNIETITEMHGGTYAGHHARYVLRCPVEIIETREAA